MNKKQKPQPINSTPPAKPVTPAGLYAVADFEQVYIKGDERLTVSCKAGALFVPPADWVRDGLAFITPDDKRILLPLKES